MIAAVLSVGVAAAFLEASAMVTDATPCRRVAAGSPRRRWPWRH